MTFYRLQAVPAYTTDLSRKDLVKWSGSEPIPAIGAEVHVRTKRIGTAKVTGYVVQDGYLGVLVLPLDPPPWWVEQYGKPSAANAELAFGAEIRRILKRA